jgi:NAD(P)-dependent dehydrogenase (short-subunit alcohol dehydrogenase family)
MPSALITGTSKGIGLETALAFARAGYKVFAGMRHPAKSPELAAIAREHGAIDVLVNNAGIEVRGSVEELPLAGFRTTMETNYFGVIRCVQQVIPNASAPQWRHD